MPLQPSLPFDLDFEAHNNNGLFADHYLNNPEELGAIGLNAQARCVRGHNIKHRIDGILNFLGKAL